MATVKVIVMAKTKRAKLCLSEGLRDLCSTPTFMGQGRHYTYAEKLLGVKS